ncbi:hypothetical protein KAR91_21280 [Candidatus Pacearchaeota archaeon]|nr:hypothetical protein [Candidatus Pacearchaeota archaeon]
MPDLVKIHRDSVIEFDKIQSAHREERKQALEDRRFYSIAGAQWETAFREQFENRPKLEVNKIALSVMRIVNEYRNNRITVDFISKKGKGDDLADTLDGLYRSDEQDSTANEAYDNAFEEAVGGGFGAWRLRAIYEDEEDDENEFQRIAIEPIYDADSTVFFDLGSKRQDKRDAKTCYVLVAMTPEDFKEKWPKEDPASFDKNVHRIEFDWNTGNVVYIAEKYQVEYENATVYIYQTIDGKEERYTEADFENDPNLRGTLDAIGSEEIRQKKVRKQRVHKYIMSGQTILEDNGLISGPNIPIVMTYGKRWVVDNVERAMGHVRLSKDVQRLKNMQLSKLAEISAVSSVEKPILTPEQILGHTEMWAEDNIKNYSYLLVNALTGKDGNVTAIGPTAYTKSPIIPPALGALLQMTEQDLKDLSGNQQAGEEVVANLSGKAVELVQNRLDMQTFIYMSNHAKGIKRSGEIWLGMAKEILVEDGRKMKLVGKQNNTSTIELNKPTMDPEANKQTLENDISKADYNIVVDVGPSSSSKRSATVRSLLAIMNVNRDPETAQVLNAMVMMNLEGEGMGGANNFFRQKLLRMGVEKPTPDEQIQLEREAANAKPTPQDEFLRKSAENEEAKAGKARADTAKSLAQTEKTNAETLEILSGIDREERQVLIDNLQLLNKAAPAQPQPTGENVSQ